MSRPTGSHSSTQAYTNKNPYYTLHTALKTRKVKSNVRSYSNLNLSCKRKIMSKELIALVHNFLVKNDGACAEIFKRGFNPDPSLVGNLPPLEEIVEQFINSTKKNLKRSMKSSSEDGPGHHDAKKIMAIAQKDPSNFLEHIVKKRIEKQEKSLSTDTDSSEEMPTSSSSSEEIVVSARKRRKLNSGCKKKVWSTAKKSKK